MIPRKERQILSPPDAYRGRTVQRRLPAPFSVVVLALVLGVTLSGLLVQLHRFGVDGRLTVVVLGALRVRCLPSLLFRLPLALQRIFAPLERAALSRLSSFGELAVVHGSILPGAEMDNPGARISLLEVEPDLARFMSAEEREAAAGLSIPVTRVPRGGVDLEALLGHGNGFGALVLDGILFSHHRAGEHTALRLLGPGDLLALPGAAGPTIVPRGAVSAAAPVTLALFGPEILLAARRWPRLVAGFHVRVAEQSERVAAQLTICQLPRVDQRLLAMMWLLAETWGHVTTAGTRLPLSLTHDALGALVGARRPTVTLALGELTERGAIVRQDRGWLLLGAPLEMPSAEPAPLEHVVLINDPPSAWTGTDASAPSHEELHEQLLSTVKRLRAEHLASRDRVRRRLAELAAARESLSETRRKRAEGSLRRE